MLIWFRNQQKIIFSPMLVNYETRFLTMILLAVPPKLNQLADETEGLFNTLKRNGELESFYDYLVETGAIEHKHKAAWHLIKCIVTKTPDTFILEMIQRCPKTFGYWAEFIENGLLLHILLWFIIIFAIIFAFLVWVLVWFLKKRKKNV